MVLGVQSHSVWGSLRITSRQGGTVGQFLHGSARTTAALRRTIQYSQESIARLAARYDFNANTVAKWRKRTSVEDAPMGPRLPHSTVL